MTFHACILTERDAELNREPFTSRRTFETADEVIEWANGYFTVPLRVKAAITPAQLKIINRRTPK